MTAAAFTEAKNDKLRKLLFHTEERFHPELMNEHNVSREYVTNGVRQIMEWYDMQPHLPKYAMDFNLIKGMFAQCKFNSEKTKRKLDCFLSVRGALPEFFADRDPCGTALQLAAVLTECAPVPTLTPEGYRVIIMRFSDEGALRYRPTEGFKSLFMISDMRIALDPCAAELHLWDFENYNFARFTMITPTIMKHSAFILQNAYTSRVRGMHLFNVPKGALPFVKAIKAFTKKKINDRIHVHESIEGLHAIIPPQCLPSEYGGTCSTMQEIHENMKEAKCTDEWREWYIRSGKEFSDESKRPVKTTFFDEITGLDGTFKKIEID